MTKIARTDNHVAFEMLERARSGDESAIRAIVNQFERLIRQLVQERQHKDARPRYDESDYVQSVLKSLILTRIHDAEFETPEHFTSYVVSMTLNKLTSHIRAVTSTKRDPTREVRTDEEWDGGVGREPDPAETAEIRDEIAVIDALLDDVDRRILLGRREGRTNREIAGLVGLEETSIGRRLRAISERITRRWSHGD